MSLACDVNANQLFKWRKQFQEGSLTAITAGEDVVSNLRLAAAIKARSESSSVCSGKTMENRILKEAVELVEGKMDCACVLVAGDDD